MFKVSVITTLYNYRDYIGKCIKSFMKQDFEDSEMIIVDDGSTDNPYPFITKYMNGRIEYIRLDKNQGYSYAKNIGIKNSNSEILVMLDADDMLTKNGILIRYEKIKEGYDFVHGPCLNLKDKRPLVRNKMWGEWKANKIYKYVHAQGVMLKKDIHRKVGLYDESLWCKSDREFFARVFHYGFKIGTVDQDVAIYRRHSRQMHQSKEKLKVNDKLQKHVLKLIEKRKTDLSGLELLEIK
ncbi:hypothetical protein LCGC14_1460640 [marine sediment metagenome]|uniref:Glycosyltransferase 2-like domain-containing protein n=1 Tax=marine sediment metagenome TaxID=412755 RepID=A0A0F9K184_9ZZZZ